MQWGNNVERIKVFLVEDEFTIRNGIRKNIDWENEGYSFVGEARDGELAYPMIIETKPDILITDIRMPFMDGITLCRLVKKELPNIKIVILSGYDDFNYAKEAIKVGVTEYLLKPISATNLLETLRGIANIIIQEKQEINGESLARLGISRELVEKFLGNGSIEELNEFVDKYVEKVEIEKSNSMTIRQYIILDVYMAIIAFCEKIGFSDELIQVELEQIQNNGNMFISVTEIKKQIYKLVSRALEIRDESCQKKHADIIVSAKELINETYMSDGISLESIAAGVGLSTSYFSAIFSKETGKTFKEFLTEIRMEKAKELLMCSSMQMSEIGYAVGYKDSHYFSYIFKKKQGCSPKEFRDRRKD